MTVNGKEISLQYFDDLSSSKQEEMAIFLSELSLSQQSKQNKIAPLQPKDIFKKYLGIVATNGAEFVGYIAAAYPIGHGELMMAKVGSLIVAAPYQNNGVGSTLLTQVTEDLVAEIVVPYAFRNPTSAKGFTRAGYRIALPGELPPGEISRFGNASVIHNK